MPLPGASRTAPEAQFCDALGRNTHALQGYALRVMAQQGEAKHGSVKQGWASPCLARHGQDL